MRGSRRPYDGDGYSNGNGRTDATERFSVAEDSSPWYLKRWVLALWGLAVVILIAVIIYGLAILARGGGGVANAHHDAPVDHVLVAYHQPVTDPVVNHSDHDGLVDGDHRAGAAADHRDLDTATPSPPLVAEQFAPDTASTDTALLSPVILRRIRSALSA